MDKSRIALGACNVTPVLVRSPQKMPMTDRVLLLEQQLKILQKKIDKLLSESTASSTYCAAQSSEKAQASEPPIGTTCIGITSKKPWPVFLKIREDGFYVGDIKYGSLSAAAEAVSGVRRSGWAFWKLPDGRTLKEAYR